MTYMIKETCLIPINAVVDKTIKTISRLEIIYLHFYIALDCFNILQTNLNFLHGHLFKIRKKLLNNLT